jgi:hypothetical protein
MGGHGAADADRVGARLQALRIVGWFGKHLRRPPLLVHEHLKRRAGLAACGLR